MTRQPGAVLVSLLLSSVAVANPPVASYIFPAGGQRGRAVDVRVGGLFLHDQCRFEMLGPGVQASKTLKKADTLWFEGPLLPLPASQRAEDYPRDMTGRVDIAADAPLGFRSWQVWTSQGASRSLRFEVGDLPEIVEREIDGAPVPAEVKLPVTINGRIFPREDVDIWTFQAVKGQPITCAVMADRLGSPLDARLEVRDAVGRVLAENDDARGADPTLHFTPPADGSYQVRIHDIAFAGSQAHVYRLTISSAPYVDHVFPLGGRRGSSVAFELSGHGLPRGKVTAALPAGAPADYELRFDLGGVASNFVNLDLDDLPEQLEAEPNNEPGQAKAVEVPAILNGRLGTPGDVDCWHLMLRKGERYEFELRALKLGSPADAVLLLEDAAGKQLARGDSPGGDPTMNFTPAADGAVCLRVASRFRSRGGPDHAYRVRVSEAVPDFALRLERDDLTIPRGGDIKVKVFVERSGGCNAEITLGMDGLPQGMSATGVIKPGQNNGVLTVKAGADVAIQPVRLKVQGRAMIDGQPASRTATLPGGPGVPDIDSALVAPAVPTPFKFSGVYVVRLVPRGTVYRRHYRLERNGFDGPLQVSLADRQARHLQGVTGPTITVPADASEFDYDVKLPPWLETGRTARVTLMAVGVVKDPDGTPHTVSFTSVAQNEQIVVVIEPGKLSVSCAPGSIQAAPGKEARVALRVERGPDLKGPVRLELIAPQHLRGVTAQPIELPADQGSAELTIKFARDLAGPFNAPLVLRATLMEKSQPVTAQTRLELEPPR
ncbi:MAG: PPC domain-containing protein [Gemmataceae bacterium]